MVCNLKLSDQLKWTADSLIRKELGKSKNTGRKATVERICPKLQLSSKSTPLNDLANLTSKARMQKVAQICGQPHRAALRVDALLIALLDKRSEILLDKLRIHEVPFLPPNNSHTNNPRIINETNRDPPIAKTSNLFARKTTALLLVRSTFQQ
jgi:hypothetical protein